MGTKLDLDFLDDVPAPLVTPEPPVNLFEILREGHLETRVDMVLKFLMDPGERHGLGTLVLDSFLALLEGAHFVDSRGRRSEAFEAALVSGNGGWELGTQVDHIDLYAMNPDLGLAVVIENKIGHEFNNPIDKYVEHALDQKGINDVIMVVLAPEARTHIDSDLDTWVSKSLTYQDLAEAILASSSLAEIAMNPKDTNQRRSLDLLQQFIEVRTRGSNVADQQDEVRLISEWRQLNEQHAAQIRAFNDRQGQVNAAMSRRLFRLKQPIIDQFRIANVGKNPGELLDSEGAGRSSTPWLRFDFPEHGRAVELKFSSDYKNHAVFIYDHDRNQKDRHIESLAVTLDMDDSLIAKAFVNRALVLVSTRS